MEPLLTDLLCTHCGLCCGGTFFSDLELAQGEAIKLEAMGLQAEEEDEGFVLNQPCAALKEKRCSIYGHRPGCCRTFECLLLQNVRRGDISLSRAKAIVAETLTLIGEANRLLAELGHSDQCASLKERVGDVLLLGESSNGDLDSKRDQLQSVMESIEGLVEHRFLGRVT